MPQILNNEAVAKEWVYKVTYSDLVAIAAAPNSIQKIAQVPAGGAVEWAYVVQTVAEAGATDIVFNVGTTIADPDEYIDALDADAMTLNLPVANTGDLMVQAAGNTTILGGLRPVSLTATALPVYLKVGGTVANLTAGEWLIGIRIWDTLKFNP